MDPGPTLWNCWWRISWLNHQLITRLGNVKCFRISFTRRGFCLTKQAPKLFSTSFLIVSHKWHDNWCNWVIIPYVTTGVAWTSSPKNCTAKSPVGQPLVTPRSAFASSRSSLEVPFAWSWAWKSAARKEGVPGTVKGWEATKNLLEINPFAEYIGMVKYPGKRSRLAGEPSFT